MYLKRIEVKGFKSFADKIELDFNGGITAIVGPNGSGKSNISDAIRWVLGEQSAKTLRGAKMEDVIFAGTETRKPLGCAEVSLTIDNSDGIVPIEYTEITVTRRLYRSGESEYLINNTPCRLRDIQEIFMDTGIGKDGYSLIGQGRVDEILSTRSEDRRNLFEEAAGIVKYKTRKLEAERKLENTRQNLLRIDDIISELEAQIEPLKEQSEVAKKYLSFKEELKELEINLILNNYNEAREKYKKITVDSDEINQTKEQEEKRKQILKEEVVSLKQNLVEIEKELERVSTERLELEKNQENKQGEIKVLNERYANFINEIDRLKNEIENNKEYILEVESSIQNLGLDNNEVLDEIQLIKNEIDKIEKEYNSLNQKYITIESDIDEKKSNLLQLLNDISQEKNKISSYEITLQNFDRRKEQINFIRSQKEEELEKVKKEKEKNDINYNNLSEKRKNKTDLFNSVLQQISFLEQEGKRLQSEKNNIISDLRSKEARCNALVSMENELEGFNKATKYILTNYKENFGVLGAVSDIIKVPKGYEVAVEIALGAAIQNIVVKNESVAIQLIDVLKKNNIGRVTFYPLNTVKYKPYMIDQKIKQMPGYLGLANEIVSFDEVYKNVVGNILGRVIICDNLENAKNIAKEIDYALRIVTLEGDVINAGGSFTGGSVVKSHGILSRKNEIEELNADIKILKETTLKYNKNIALNNEKINDYFIKKNEIDQEIKSIEKEIQILVGKQLFYEKQIEDINKNIKDIEVELEHIEIETQNVKKKLEEREQQLKLLEEKQASIQEYVENTQRDIKDLQVKKDVLHKELTDKRILYAEKNKILEGISERRKQLEKEKNNYENRIKNYELEIENLNIKIEHTKENIRKNLIELQKYAEDIIKVKEEYYLFEGKKREITDIIQSKEKDIVAVEESISSVINSIHKLDIMKNKLENEIEVLINKLWEEYELSIPQAVKYKKEIKNVGEISKRVNELKANIRSLGDVNVNSIEEYKRVVERYSFLKQQREDLINAEKSLVGVINEMVQKMTEQFKYNFRIIRENFNLTFKELFGGGYADLRLDGDDVLNAGIEIIVQPPGKKLQTLSLLSGGERGLAAIALIFAILKMKPTPFCVLDEIEAALDDANVNRFAEFLKDYSTRTQFIIITHRKGSMAAADTLYGVTMEEKGVSKVVSLKLEGGK
ncbi:chromosome segregation protein SMC [Caloramator proteoclasticus]|uniref:Chromosome partition protein Smc n=1 Tax=Caloramator proteoclasticus DSM 10124 TaxID=1121262 RepID=A0A1M4SIS6_9CLOT|nr:chromosome segregation protein SMC [Caloramator proteoclasticus]SHE32110.1 condensin subunit Smc [Caloramator proteoclasticus DSM 10124]